MVDCPCGFGKDIPEDRPQCPICGTDVSPLHRIRQLPLKYHAEGLRAANDGRLEFAIERLSTAIVLDENCGPAHKSLGDTYAKKGMYEHAVGHYLKALQIQPHDGALRQTCQDAQKKVNPGTANPPDVQRRQLLLFQKLLVVVPVIAFLLGVVLSPTVNLLRRNSPPEPDLARFSAQVKDALASEPSLNGISMDVAQIGNSLHISGDVPTDVHKRLISAVAETVVHNRIPVILDMVVSTAPRSSLYTVRPGDSLSSLAAKEYGDVRLWTKIYAANRDKLSNPNGLIVGQALVIPK